METYSDEADFYDYIHKLSRTPILKAQHPDYEIAQMGIHILSNSVPGWDALPICRATIP